MTETTMPFNSAPVSWEEAIQGLDLPDRETFCRILDSGPWRWVAGHGDESEQIGVQGCDEQGWVACRNGYFLSEYPIVYFYSPVLATREEAEVVVRACADLLPCRSCHEPYCDDDLCETCLNTFVINGNWRGERGSPAWVEWFEGGHSQEASAS